MLHHRGWIPRLLLLALIAVGLTAMHTVGHATHTPVPLPDMTVTHIADEPDTASVDDLFGSTSGDHDLGMLFLCLAVLAAALILVLVGGSPARARPIGTSPSKPTDPPTTTPAVISARRTVVLRI